MSGCTRWAALAVIAIGAGACGGGSSGADAGPDGRAAQADGGRDVTRCAQDGDCLDGAYCNGVERCMPGAEGAAANGCVPGAPPCAAGEACDEDADACGPAGCADADEDGDPSRACGGGDCDDDDARVRSGFSEACDPLGLDEDCDESTLYNAGPGTNDGDRDGDGFVDARCFNVRADGTEHRGTDCDDTAPTINTDGVEACDTRDNDCDGALDEGVRFTYYLDGDGDGAGDEAASQPGCTPPGPGWILAGGDCDPADPDIHDGASEVCDGLIDHDCDDAVDDGCACTNGATQPCGPGLGICAGALQTCIGGAWSACPATPRAELCDGSLEDEDCDGLRNEDCACVSGTSRPCGAGACAGTQTCVAGALGPCVDASGDPVPSPAPMEICDGVDSDCDGVGDADDADVVGAGASCGTNTGLCVTGTQWCTSGSLVCQGDVPPAGEICDHRDDDCDGARDEGVSAATCDAVATAFTELDGVGEYELGLRATDLPAAWYLGPEPTDTVDWGRVMEVQAQFSLRIPRGGRWAGGHVGVVVSPVRSVGTSASRAGLLPPVRRGEHGLAALMLENVFAQRLYIMEMDEFGARELASVTLPTGCRLVAPPDDTSSGPARTFTVTLRNTGPTLTATVTSPGACSATVTHTLPGSTWHDRFYGADETAPYPRWNLGAIAVENQDLSAELLRLRVARTRTSAGDGHCVPCPW